MLNSNHYYVVVLCLKFQFSFQFAGAAQSLGAGAILVNPWNITEVAASIGYALNMPADEREKRHWHNFMHVTTHTSQEWALTFVRCGSYYGVVTCFCYIKLFTSSQLWILSQVHVFSCASSYWWKLLHMFFFIYFPNTLFIW